MAGMDIGHRIKNARQNAGYTQREFAKRLDVSAGLVGQWENHTKVPGRDNLQKIARLAFTTMEELLGKQPAVKTDQPPLRPDQLELLRRYERLPVHARQKAREWLGVAADMTRVEKQKA